MISAEQEEAEILLNNEYLQTKNKDNRLMYEDVIEDFIDGFYSFLQKNIEESDRKTELINSINLFEGHFLEYILSFALFRNIPVDDDALNNEMSDILAEFMHY